MIPTLHEGHSQANQPTHRLQHPAWVLTSETRYVYDGMLAVQDRDGSNIPTVTYTRGIDFSGTLQAAGGIGGLLARSHGYSTLNGSWSTHSQYHANGSGNITFMVNSSQGTVAIYRYDPFGNLIGAAGALSQTNLYRFFSKLAHPASGLYDYGYRFYNPNLQRWLNPDPILENGGINFYTFVNNRPVNGIDPVGLKMSKADCGALLRKMAKAHEAAQKAAKEDAWDATIKENEYQRLANSYNRNCEEPPEPPSSPAPCPIILPSAPPNPFQNNRGYCSNHPWVCGGIAVGIGVGAVCVINPPLCVGAIRIGIWIARRAAPAAL